MKIFEASEIYQFAMRIEENGEKFYRRAANITEDDEARYLSNFLADEEVNHKKVFGALLSKIGKYEPDEQYPGEYIAYLRDYLDNKVIFSTKSVNEEFCDIKDTLSALDFAVNREVDSILYYGEMKNFVAKNQSETIDKIIVEERKHFSKLTKFKKEYEKR